MRVFRVALEMGNDAMRLRAHVAKALEGLATELRNDRTRKEGKLRDENGNTVGIWEMAEVTADAWKVEQASLKMPNGDLLKVKVRADMMPGPELNLKQVYEWVRYKATPRHLARVANGTADTLEEAKAAAEESARRSTLRAVKA